MIQTGLFAGTLAVIGTSIIIEKIPIVFRRWIFKHYLFSDLFFTGVALLLLPVKGMATLLTSLTYMILFSLYLMWRRKAYGFK
jgi:hypothetical protein